MKSYLFGINPTSPYFDGYDIAKDRSGPGRYWVAAHTNTIESGDIGFVHRYDGGDGSIAGVLLITGPAWQDQDGWWVDINLRPLPKAAWVDGAVLAKRPEWRRRKPYGTPKARQFANPIQLDDARRDSIGRLLRPSDRRFLGI